MKRALSLGIDFGSGSARAVLVDARDGSVAGVGVSPYASGRDGVVVSADDPHLARQRPQDYVASLRDAVRGALAEASGRGFGPDDVRGIGVDTTGSTPIPVDRRNVPLAFHDEFRDELAALAWMWKDHTAHAEAAEICARIRALGRPYLSTCGGVYSSEWYWAKILRCERAFPRVAAAAWSWVEFCDWIPAYLCGLDDPATAPRGICAAGHKALYHPSWGGLPDAEFLDALAPGLSRFRARYRTPASAADERAGGLAPLIAAELGLRPGTPVAVGAFDAHLGAVGAGVGPGTLVKIIGTACCDCTVAPLAQPLGEIPGVCGIVPGSILPGHHGIEAGQSAVGDLFNWFVSQFGRPGETQAETHRRFTRESAGDRPGRSGLLALDWHNGNRCVLVDPRLSGLVLGQTLATTPAEIYRSLIEATAFGARVIVERMEDHGVAVERVVCCGGIAEKNAMLMQIYADVLRRPLAVSRSDQTCALGSAILGAVVGGVHRDVPAAQAAMTGVRAETYSPRPAAAAVYDELYALYRRLHDAFGVGGPTELGDVMKKLLAIADRAREAS
jgi:L-ribulokinase